LGEAQTRRVIVISETLRARFISLTRLTLHTSSMPLITRAAITPLAALAATPLRREAAPAEAPHSSRTLKAPTAILTLYAGPMGPPRIAATRHALRPGRARARASASATNDDDY